MPTTRALRLLAAAALLVAVVTAPATAARPGWSPIKDVNKPYIQELGGWAVAEHAKQAKVKGLEYRKVTGGEQQVMAGNGMNYNLVLDVMDANGRVAAYKAFVFDQPSTNTRELIFFVGPNWPN